MKHELKTWPLQFEAIRRNVKTFEARFDDRNFKVGDVLLLKEWNPISKQYTGRFEERLVTYKLEGGQFGIQSSMCIMSIVPNRKPSP